MTDVADLWTAWTRRRDERAFETLVVPELPRALRFARGLGCGDADAEDALQDALARLAAVRDSSPTTIGLRAWLFREVHARARSRLRSERRRKRRESLVATAEARADDRADVGVREQVERALAELDDDERAAVELRHLHDLDYREIALVLGASEGACRQRVHKALARLRARLGDDAPALVAALPLPVVDDGAALVKRAVANSAAASAATGGSAMTTTTTAWIAAAAAAAGVGATLVFERIAVRDVPVAAPPSADASEEIARRDAEIAKLRAQLANSKTRRAERAEVVASTAPPAAAPQDPTQATSETTVVRIARPAPAGPVDVDAAGRRSMTWQAAIRQTSDPAKRDAAWSEARRALAGADPTELVAALRTVASTADVKLDRVGIRDLVLPHVDATATPVRLEAWQALIYCGIEPIDVERLRAQTAAATGPTQIDLLMRLAWALGRTKSAFDGPFAETALTVLDDPNQRKDAVWALQNARLNDAVVAKVLEYARSGPEAADLARQFVLRALPDKNHDVVAWLLDRAEAGDLSGIEQFQSTIRAEDVPYAGARLRKLADARSASFVRVQAIDQIGRIGDVASRDWLVALRDDDAQDASVRAAAKSALGFLDRPRR